MLAGLLAIGACGTTQGEKTKEQHPKPKGSAAATKSSEASPLASPSPSVLAPSSPGAQPAFAGASALIDATTRAAMLASGSWRRGDPVAIADLRLLTLSYWGFDHRAHTGRLLVNASVASDVLRAMKTIYEARFPIRRMELVDAYEADDDRSMAADNTSAYNGRKVPGSTSWSQHAYGLAIDIDPRENPMVQDGEIYPPNGARFVDRTLRVAGMIHPGGVVVRAFAEIGWEWGGDWHSIKDYQHFSQNGT